MIDSYILYPGKIFCITETVFDYLKYVKTDG